MRGGRKDHNTFHIMKNSRYHFHRWILKATLGLSLIGFGACLIAEAALTKYDGAATTDWVLYGFFALIVLNSGVSIMGDAVKHRVHLERHREQEQHK